MNVFTQTVYVIGRLTPDSVQMLGTGFLVRADGLIATSQHVIGNDATNLVILAPHINDINKYQDLSDNSCNPIQVEVAEVDPIRDLAILRSPLRFAGVLPQLGSFDHAAVGSEVGIFGFPHCSEGRRALTFQRTEIGAKVKLRENGVESKHAVINTQARPGQSGSPVFSLASSSILGVLVGAWAPSMGGGISLGGINPRELHQTTHCVSAEHLRGMI